MRFAFKNAGVNSVTVGYKNTAEIDEAIENLNLALRKGLFAGEFRIFV
jgi:hypothetical protein